MSTHDDTGHPVGPEIDDSQNPTDASPETDPTGEQTSGDESAESRQSRDMLVQLQQMIDAVAAQAGPVMRDVAAKTAELAALAAERAGPIAHRAAEATERMSGRVAVRSKEVAAELRRQRHAESASTGPEDEADAGAAGESSGFEEPADTSRPD